MVIKKKSSVNRKETKKKNVLSSKDKKKKSVKRKITAENLISEENEAQQIESDSSQNDVSVTKSDIKKYPSLKFDKESDIALDFSTKVYKKFNQVIKAIILFGSTAKQTAVIGSDIDIIIIIDDVSVRWTRELIAWYREELDKILVGTPYKKSLHINTIKLSTWWDDLMKGDPVIINILRYGQAMIDFAGFFNPLKFLLLEGKIKSTPEAIYNCLQRAPTHILRSKVAELNSIEGLYWAMVDASHAALIAARILPPSPEHIASNLEGMFVNQGKLNKKYVEWFKGLLDLHKRISHGQITDLKGVEIDDWQEKTQEFLNVMAKLVEELIQ